MRTVFPFFTFMNDASLNIRDAFNSIVTDQNVSRDRLATELGIDVERLGVLLDATAPDNLETRQKIELFKWADGVLGFTEAELELELDAAAKRFRIAKSTLKGVLKARRNEKKKDDRARERGPGDAPEDKVIYYGRDFRASNRGVFARRIDPQGSPDWEVISSTRIDLAALTRDARAENWGCYVVLTNRDGGIKRLAIPHALIAGDKAVEIAGLLASLGVGVVANKWARQNRSVPRNGSEAKDHICPADRVA